MLIRRADVAGRSTDVRIAAGRIEQIGSLRPDPHEDVVDAAGGALLPGFADHHLHLLAAAAAAGSVDLTGADRARATALLRDAAGSGTWVRAVGWSEDCTGDLDATALDALSPGSGPLRVQHRSGALWVLNTRALQELADLDDPAVERDAAGNPTGRLWRGDHLLRTAGAPPDLAALGRRLAAYGITHLTDATPDLDPVALQLLSSGALSQRLLLLGAPIGWAGAPRAAAGPYKIVVTDHALPDPDALATRIAAVHAADRAVAVHCASRVGLVLTLNALAAAGSRSGDRVEHAAVAGPAEAAALARLKVRVVTQPSLPVRRGRTYLAGSEEPDRDHLWPYASLLESGVRVACSSDAPYGDPDPWVTIRAARDRAMDDGTVIGERERVPAATAFASLLTDPRDPGRLPRRVTPGAEADLMLLHVPPAEAVRRPSADLVRCTICAGVTVFGDSSDPIGSERR
ncbi:MAG TPA: amidohydrolase family protein [Mycobacteriales bacterium]|nr:amidohydrolase family protein [Mycobacteriales bacterium]